MQTYENYQEGYRIALKHYVLLNVGPNKMAEDTHTPSQSLATALHSVTDKSDNWINFNGRSRKTVHKNLPTVFLKLLLIENTSQ